MLLQCDIQVNNRLVPPQNLRAPPKCSRGAVELFRKAGKETTKEKIYTIVVYTNKAKSGVKYRIKENIVQVFSRFTDNGRATISFKDPQHDVCISKANPHDLKRLLHGIKLGYKGEDVPGANTSQCQKCCQNILETSKLDMKILSRNSYPLKKSFPSSLEKLVVNKCQLQKFDHRVLKLSNLRVLDLSENNLKGLPESLDGLVNLKELYLSRNQFQDIPMCLFNPVLKSNIRLLSLSSNLLETLPFQLCLLENLTNLQLDNNKINALPNNIGMLKSLRYLSIAQNKITFLPYGFGMLNIDSLDLSGNPLGFNQLNPIKLMKLTAVPTLFEKAARIVIEKGIIYTEKMLPQHILWYLKSAKVCLCRKVCFESYAIYTTTLDLGKIAHTVTADIVNSGRMQAPVEGYLCSLKCYNKWQSNPNSIWK